MIRNGRKVSNVPIFRTRDLEEETTLRLKRKESARMKRTSLSLFFFLRRENIKVFKVCVCECESTRVFLQFFLNADVG